MKHAYARRSNANSKVQANMHTSRNNQCNPDTQYSNTWTMHTSHDCKSNTKSIIIIIYIKKEIINIIMYIYHALINALSTHMLHINLSMIFCSHVEHSPTKTIYIKYYTKTTTTKTYLLFCSSCCRRPAGELLLGRYLDELLPFCLCHHHHAHLPC